MKKLSIFFASMLAVVGLTGCSEDTEPVYHNPTEFTLNTPALQQQYYELSEDGQFQLYCSQPDYGYSAIATYTAQVSLTEDFAESVALENKQPHMAAMLFNDSDLALALCTLNGIESEEQKDEYNARDAQRVYFRATCEIEGVEGSAIVSNVVYLDKVKGYFAVPVAGYIYLVGAPEGWAGPSESNATHYQDWRLFEADDAIGSKVYSGVFNIPAGSAMFRFYTALTGWDTDSYGSQEDDNPIEYSFSDVFESSIVKGKGSFSFPDWAGGDMTIVVNLNEMTLTIYAGAQEVVTPKYVYMVGNNGDWAEPVAGTYEDWKLVDSSNSGVYSNTFDLTNLSADDLYCRFYSELTGWGAAQWASTTGDNYTCELGVAVPTAVGEGCFLVPGAKGKTITVSLDTNNNTVTFQ